MIKLPVSCSPCDGCFTICDRTGNPVADAYDADQAKQIVDALNAAEARPQSSVLLTIQGEALREWTGRELLIGDVLHFDDGNYRVDRRRHQTAGTGLVVDLVKIAPVVSMVVEKETND